MKKFAYVLISTLVFASGCGDEIANLAGKAKSLGIDSEATIADDAKAQETFEQVLPAVQEAVSDAMASAGGSLALKGMVPQQDIPQIGDQTIEIDQTVSDDNGTKYKVSGTVKISVSKDGTIMQEQDVSITWDGGKVYVEDVEVTTSGVIVMTGSMDIKVSQSANASPEDIAGQISGSFAQVGQITADGDTFGFDIQITISAGKITIVGTINGVTTEETIDLSEFGQEQTSSTATTDTTNGATDTTQ